MESQGEAVSPLPCEGQGLPRYLADQPHILQVYRVVCQVVVTIYLQDKLQVHVLPVGHVMNQVYADTPPGLVICARTEWMQQGSEQQTSPIRARSKVPKVPRSSSTEATYCTHCSHHLGPQCHGTPRFSALPGPSGHSSGTAVAPCPCLSP